MNENKELSPESIRLIYRDCLYGLKKDIENPGQQNGKSNPSNTIKAAEKSETKEKPQKKTVAVLTDSAIVTNNSDLRYKFLVDIIKACKLTMDDAVITDLFHDSKEHIRILEKYQPDVILLFGVTPADLMLPMIFPNFQIQKIGTHTYISAPALEILEPDKSSKTRLWNCLKQVFSI
ncbi:MAG: hypothetical protein ACO29O_08870 [Chitinophagaceae bacterium]